MKRFHGVVEICMTMDINQYVIREKPVYSHAQEIYKPSPLRFSASRLTFQGVCVGVGLMDVSLSRVT